MKAWLDYSQTTQKNGLEESLMDLVKMRASQINGCAFCLDMHTTEARRRGETEQRLYLIDAWHDSSLYSERERAALAWTEALRASWRPALPTMPITRSRRNSLRRSRWR